MLERHPAPEPGTESEAVDGRVGAVVVDGLVVLATLVAAVVAVGAVRPRGGAVAGVLLYVLLPVVHVVYHAVAEAYYGRTPGKAMFGLVVVRADGSRCTTLAAVARNLLRPVDGLPAFYLLGLTSMLLTDRSQRLGDLVGRTVVVSVADEAVHEEWADASDGPDDGAVAP